VPVKRTKFKLSDKRAALVDLGRHLGLFEKDNTQAAKAAAAAEAAAQAEQPSDRALARAILSILHTANIEKDDNAA
jgi:hypothetical protein